MKCDYQTHRNHNTQSFHKVSIYKDSSYLTACLWCCMWCREENIQCNVFRDVNIFATQHLWQLCVDRKCHLKHNTYIHRHWHQSIINSSTPQYYEQQVFLLVTRLPYCGQKNIPTSVSVKGEFIALLPQEFYTKILQSLKF